MENSLNIPSSPSLPYFHILQTSPWRIHSFLRLAGTCWRIRTVAKTVCRSSVVWVPICPSVYAAQTSGSEEGKAHRACVRREHVDGGRHWWGCAAPGGCLSLMPRLPGLWAAQPSAATCHLPGPPPGLQKHKLVMEDSNVGEFNCGGFF